MEFVSVRDQSCDSSSEYTYQCGGNKSKRAPPLRHDNIRYNSAQKADNSYERPMLVFTHWTFLHQ